MTTIPRKIGSTDVRAMSTASTLRVYLRQSISEDRNEHGIDAQRRISERFARANNLPWADRVEYIDVGYSRDDLTRPEYLRLIAETGAGDTILLWERNRLGVDLDYAVAVRDLIQRRGARIMIANTGETLDVGGDFGTVIEAMHGSSQGAQLRFIRTSTRSKLRERARNGYVSTALPYGLRTVLVDPTVADRKKSLKRGEIVPEEAKIVERIATMYADGAGWERIANTLNREGVPSPRGGKWSRSNVWDVIHNRIYRGEYTVGVRGGKGGKIAPETFLHPEWKIGSDEVWARVDAARAARTTDMPGCIANGAKHPLAGGSVRCICGGSLMLQSDRRRTGERYMVYQCMSRRRSKACAAGPYRVDKAHVERGLGDALEGWFEGAREAIAGAVREVEARIGAQAAPDLTAIDRTLAQARAEQTKLIKLAMVTGGEVDAVADALKLGQAKITALMAERARASAPRVDAGLLGRQIHAEAIKRLNALRDALRGPDARDAIQTLFPAGLRLRVTEETIVIEGDGVVLPPEPSGASGTSFGSRPISGRPAHCSGDA